MHNSGGIGPFLELDEAMELSSTLMLAFQGEDKELGKRARSRLLYEYRQMTAESRPAVRDVVETFQEAEILAALDKSEAKIQAKP